MNHCPRFFGVLLFSFATVVIHPGQVLAQSPTTASSALAEARFQEGRDLFKQERFPEACAKFEESQKLEPKLGTLLRLALCHEKIGRIATAWAEYTSAAAIASREGQDEREQFARKQIETLSQLMSQVTIKVPTAEEGLVVTLDDLRVDGAFLNKPFPVDPGSHYVQATAPDKKKWSTLVQVPLTKSEINVEVPALESSTRPAPAPDVPRQTDSSSGAIVKSAPIVHKPITPTQPNSTGTTLAVVGFGAGAVGLLLGSITGIVAIGKAGPLIAACPRNQCPEEQRKELAAVNTMANVANVGFGVGIAGVVVGIVGIVKAGRSAPSSEAGAFITPLVGPGTWGITGRF